MAFPVSTKEKGNCFAFPDTCKTPAPPAPPVPIPYPNMAMLTQGNPGTMDKKVKINNQAPAVLNTQITQTAGDEAGSVGGVVSGQIKGPATFKKASSKVKFSGKGAAFLTCTVAQNGASANAPMGVQISPSQNKVTVLV